MGRKSKWVHNPSRLGVLKAGRMQTDYITPSFWVPNLQKKTTNVTPEGSHNGGGGSKQLHNTNFY